MAVVLTGRRAPPHWSSPGEPFDVYDIARVLEVVAAEAYPGGRVVPVDGGAVEAPYVVGRGYALRSTSGEMVGRAGEIDPGAMDLPRWAGVVVGGEVVLPSSPAPRPEVTARDLPDQPAVQRDLAFLVPADTAVGRVLEAARTGAGKLLEAVEVFDLYEGDDLPPSMRSVALRLRFRARGRTLTDKEVDKACRRVLGKVKENAGVEARR